MRRKWLLIIGLFLSMLTGMAQATPANSEDTSAVSLLGGTTTKMTERQQSIADAKNYLLGLNIVQKARLKVALNKVNPKLSVDGDWEYFINSLPNKLALHVAKEVRVTQDSRSDAAKAKDKLSKKPEAEHVGIVKSCAACHSNKDESKE